MRYLYSKIMLTLILSMLSSWIVYGQPSPGDSVLISRDQQKQCIKWYGEIHILRDSILPAMDSVILVQSNFIISTEEKLYELDDELTAANLEIEKKAKRLKRTRWIAGGIGAAGIIGWLGFILLK